MQPADHVSNQAAWSNARHGPFQEPQVSSVRTKRTIQATFFFALNNDDSDVVVEQIREHGPTPTDGGTRLQTGIISSAGKVWTSLTTFV